MVPLNGLEPLLPCRNEILNLACLPIPPQRHKINYNYLDKGMKVLKIPNILISFVSAPKSLSVDRSI